MFKLKRNAIIDFDSERLCVMENGVLLYSSPAVVIRKKSETPVAVAFGEEAEKRKNDVQPNEFYSHPFKNGKITDEKGARLLFRYVLRDLFGKNPFLRLFVIVPGGMDEQEERKIEATFALAGYGKVTLLPRPVILAKLLEYNSLHGALYMDADVTEFVLASNGEVYSANTIGVSSSAAAEVLRERFLTDQKLNVPLDTSVQIAVKECSLFPSDITQLSVHGLDTVTNQKKSVFVSSREIFPSLENVYSNVTDLISAVLLDEDKDFSLEVAHSGILFAGSGTQIRGFEEFTYKRLGISGVYVKNPFLLLEVACSYVEQLTEND